MKLRKRCPHQGGLLLCAHHCPPKLCVHEVVEHLRREWPDIMRTREEMEAMDRTFEKIRDSAP